tara:strand:- start:1449 stop:2375 length:927 start_codon:yes stop_codon:yes gene_type:complete
MSNPERPLFLGLDEDDSGPCDIVILPVPLEMTVSYGEGTANGPRACLEASSQVELYDPLLPSELPCGALIRTEEEWSSDAPSLREQLDSIRDFVEPWMDEGVFPIVLGGEHGILLPIVEAVRSHPGVSNLGDLTIVQVDAHADLRDELNGERLSHGTVIRRVLEEGVGRVIQIGTRSYSEEEASLIEADDRIETWFARDLLGLSEGRMVWEEMNESVSGVEGPVWLTFDIDGLDGSLVPDTGTPVPGGLSHWAAVEVIEGLFSGGAEVIGADVNEIAPGEDRLTQFNAALIATKILAAHISSRPLSVD